MHREGNALIRQSFQGSLRDEMFPRFQDLTGKSTKQEANSALFCVSIGERDGDHRESTRRETYKPDCLLSYAKTTVLSIPNVASSF